MAGILKRPTTQPFNGQSDIVIGLGDNNKYSDSFYSSATISLKSFDDLISVGQVVEDTTDFTGDDSTIDTINDEQGNVIVTSSSQGTIAFTFSLANLSNAAIEFFMRGETSTIATSDVPAFIESSAAFDVVKFGTQTSSMTRPVGIINADGTKMFFMPKANIVSTLGFEDSLLTISVTVTATTIDINELGTAMIISAPVKYEATTVSPLNIGISSDTLDSPIMKETSTVKTKNNTL